jgi:putative ATP-dependent endonuclease of OLD family
VKTGILLSRVRLQNFRGIKDITVELDRETVLIGENNTGKTTFLHALNICLQQLRSARSAAFDTYDLHFGDGTTGPTTAQPLVITLTFAEDIVGRWAPEVVQALAGLTVLDAQDRNNLTVEFTGTPSPVDGSIDPSWRFLDETGNQLMNSEARRPSALSTVQGLAPIFYLTALRDAASNFGARGKFWRPFLNEGGIPPEKRQEVIDALHDVNDLVIANHQSLGQVRARLAALRDIIAAADAADVSIDAIPPRIFDMLSRTQVSLTAPGGAPVPLERHGDGTQSLAVLLLFDAFLKAKLASGTNSYAHPILALEEPEAHLHPGAIRALHDVLRDLEGQKVISTHSGDLLAEVDINNIRRFARRGGKIEVFRVPPGVLAADDVRKVNHHIRRSRGELLFARCWLLVEGETEVTVFDGVARRLGKPLDRSGVRIVEFAHVGLAPLVKVADLLGIPWHLVCDGDPAGQNYAKATRSALGARVEAQHLTHWAYKTIEVVLCHSGFDSIYENAVPAATVAQWTKAGKWPAKTAPDYYDVLLEAVGKFKVSCAHEVVSRMDGVDPASLPAPLTEVIKRVLALAEA